MRKRAVVTELGSTLGLVQRLIRSVLEVRWDPMMRPALKATLTKALKDREKIRRAGWFS